MYISNDSIYQNLFLYEILKNLNRAGLSHIQLNDLISTITSSNSSSELELKFKEKVSSAQKSKDAFKDILFRINTVEVSEGLDCLNFNDIKIILIVSSHLIIFKNDILDITKEVSNFTLDYTSEQKNSDIEGDDKSKGELIDPLSLKFDLDNLSTPYLKRVFSMLYLDKLFEGELSKFPDYSNKINNKLSFNINDFSEQILEFNNLNNTKFDNNLNIKSIFSIILNESISQRSKQSGGASYEKRILGVLKTFADKDSIQTQKHDTKHPEVEYDFKFKINNIPIGISAKRTLRERYKQNLMDIDDLDVDQIIVITLGLDLRETIIKEILSYNGSMIVISQEIYEKEILNNPIYKEYLHKIISSNCFTKQSILNNI